MRLTKFLSTILMISLLTGCSIFSGERIEPDIPEEQLYEESISAIDASNWPLAIEKLQKLEARYPFGRYSEQAQLELIYAYSRSNKQTSAAAAADRFIRLHPNHENVDYAYYMKGWQLLSLSVHSSQNICQSMLLSAILAWRATPLTPLLP